MKSIFKKIYLYLLLLTAILPDVLVISIVSLSSNAKYRDIADENAERDTLLDELVFETVCFFLVTIPVLGDDFILLFDFNDLFDLTEILL